MSATHVHVRMTVGDFSLYLIDYAEYDDDYEPTGAVDPALFSLVVDVMKDRASLLEHTYYSQHNLQYTSYNEFIRSLRFSNTMLLQSPPRVGRPRRNRPECP